MGANPVDALFAGATRATAAPAAVDPHAAVDSLFANVPTKKSGSYPLTAMGALAGAGELLGSGAYNLIPAAVNSANDLIHIGRAAPKPVMNYASPGAAGLNLAQHIGALPIPGMRTDATGRLSSTGAPVTISSLLGSFGNAAAAEKPWLDQTHPTLAAPIEKTGRAVWDAANLVPAFDTANLVKSGITSALREAPGAVTKEQLATQAKAAYQEAKTAGVVLKPQTLTNLQSSAAEDLRQQGLDRTLHPATTAALGRLTETKGALPLDELEILRRVGLHAETNSVMNPSDSRLAGELVDHIDDTINNLKPSDVDAGNPQQAAQALNNARDLWSRKRKADTIDELMRRADLRASQFSGSGQENAVRTEFRSLAMNQKRMRYFSPDERASIEKVAKGGPVENVLRWVGKLSPSSPVSAGASTFLGLTLGGPVGAAASVGGGLVSRKLATRATMRNADRAGEVMRGSIPGGLPLQLPGPLTNRLAAMRMTGLLGPGAANNPADQ